MSLPLLSRVATEAPSLRQLLTSYCGRRATPLTVRDLYEVGSSAMHAPLATQLLSARWLCEELPVRLAHRVHELENLPYGLASMPSVENVRDMYVRSFEEIVECNIPETKSEEESFSEVLDGIRSRHDKVVRLIARGVLELKEHCGKSSADMGIRGFLDRFYMSRIGIRVLISHHVALGEKREREFPGIINRDCNPANVAKFAVDAARSIAYRNYGECPDVQLLGNVDLKFPYVDAHLFLCLFELIKNSLRATIETHRDASSLPPVRLTFADGVEDVTIKISDEGGGFRRSEMDRVWTYLFTTAKLTANELLDAEERPHQCDNRPDPIAGFGYGLPLSRLYARYWGGELSLTSMEGYGTDAFLHLCKIGNKTECATGLTPANTV